MIRNVATWFGSLMIAALVLGTTGCEDSGGDSSSDHDFGDNNTDVVVALGDSITRGYGLGGGESYPSQLAGMTGRPVINTGIDGERSSGGRSRVNGVLNQHNPGYLLILYGSNDIIQNDTGNTIANLRAIVQAAKANKTIPIIGTIPPAFGTHGFMAGGVAALNPQIEAMAEEEGARLVNSFGALNDQSLFLSDGLHPNAAGAVKLADAFEGRL